MALSTVPCKQGRSAFRCGLVGHGPKPQEGPCGRRALRRSHILIALLLHTFLPSCLPLLASRHKGNAGRASCEQYGANDVAHDPLYSFPRSSTTGSSTPLQRSFRFHQEANCVLPGSECGCSVECSADRSIQIRHLPGEPPHDAAGRDADKSSPHNRDHRNPWVQN